MLGKVNDSEVDAPVLSMCWHHFSLDCIFHRVLRKFKASGCTEHNEIDRAQRDAIVSAMVCPKELLGRFGLGQSIPNHAKRGGEGHERSCVNEDFGDRGSNLLQSRMCVSSLGWIWWETSFARSQVVI